MKIYFDNVNFDSSSGPHTFATRLAQELSLQGHVIADCDDYDVALVFIEKTQRLNTKKPFVQRLDGIWFRPDEFATRNVNIKTTYYFASSVVFQSDFDKTMIQKWWGEHKSGHIIRNGIKLEKVKTKSEALLHIHDMYKKVFVCSANWHPQKRLSNNIELFEHIRSTIEPFSCLIVMGNGPDKVVSDMNIYYTGSVPHQTCLEIYSISDWMLHLAYLDHSPNVVCEALSQGCPVICSESGGTKELVENNGLILKESQQYNFELFDYEKPPNIDVLQLKTLPNIKVDASKLDIKSVAQQYIDIFKQVVS